MCTNNYLNKEKIDTVIAKIKWCSFLPHSVEVAAPGRQDSQVISKLLKS